MNMNCYCNTKKIICLFALIIMLFFVPDISFSEQDRYETRSLYDTVMEQGIFSINVQPVSNLPPAGAIPIDNLIRQISEQDSFVTYPDAEAAFKQQRLNFLKKNRSTFLKWPKDAITRLDNYAVEYKGSLEALNDLQVLAEIIKCHQNGGTPGQCAQQAGTDALMRMAGGKVITYLGLGSLATFGALAIADYEAVVNTVKLYNEATGLIEDEKTAEKQRIDRMAMGADVGLMRSYLELMLVRYEQNQNISGDLLIKFWEDAEDQSKKLNTAIDQFTGTWKEIENKNYPHQLQNNCEKSCNLDENCSALISSYTALTGNSLPETRENTSSLTNEFQMVLNGNFEQNCIERSDDIKNKIEPIIQKKVDPLHKWYKSLDVCITHARQAHEKYLSNQKNYLQDNQTLNQRFEQQLAERYGKDSDKYKEGMAYLDQIRNQIKTYQPRGLKGNMEYILRRLDTIAEDFKFIKNRLVKVFDVIETHIEVINKVEKDFKSTAQLKSEELANKFETCANDMISNQTANLAEENTVPQQLAEIDQKLNFAATLSENIKNECNSTKGMVDALVSRAASNQKELIAIEAGLVDLFNKSGDFKKAEQGIKTEHASIEKQVEKAAEITHELEALSREICEKTMELNDYTRSDVVHQQNHKWIRDQKTKLKSLLDAIQLIVTNARVTHAAGGIQTDQGASPGDRSGQKIEQDLEKIAGNISAVKDSLLNANSILSGIKEKSTQAVSIKNFSLAELEKLKNYIDALPKTDSVRQMKIKYDNLSQKAGSIQTNDCVNTLSGDLINVIISFKKDEELLPKINAFYKTQKQQLLKNDSIQKSIQNTVQDISYLVDLSEAYLERAGNGAKDGALCTVLADDIMKKEFVPRVVEMKVGLAESALSNKGFRTIKIKDKKLSSGKLPFHVTKQVPDHTKRRALGSKVEVYYYDESSDQVNESLNVETVELDCSHLPGSQEMVIFDTGERLCDCPPTKTWNADFTACIDKSNALPSQDEMQKARQDLFLSMKNCSQFPGTEPVWDTQKDEAVCACKNGLILNASGNGCITPQQAAMQNIDCSPFPNTTPVWNQAQQKAVCTCIQGTVLNRNGNGCIDQREFVLMNTDCSRFPGTFPEWNYQNNQPMCSCLSGSHWDDISGGCVSDTENEYLLDCSAWANTLPGWNLQTQKLECMCMSPNIIDQGTGECISWVDALIEPQNPPDNNGTNPPPPSTIKQGQCNEARKAGRNEPERHVINIGSFAGQFIFEYKTFTEPDMIKVSQPDGRVLFQTGCVGSGNGWTPVTINFSGYSSEIIVDVYPNCAGGTNTQWEFKVSCPN